MQIPYPGYLHLSYYTLGLSIPYRLSIPKFQSKSHHSDKRRKRTNLCSNEVEQRFGVIFSSEQLHLLRIEIVRGSNNTIFMLALVVGGESETILDLNRSGFHNRNQILL